MKTEYTLLPIEKLTLNEGQIEGLPTNPRAWTQDDIDRLAKSILETPELFEARPLIVIPNNDAFVVLCGNMRLCASKQNKATNVPAIILPVTTPIAKLKEIVIKDNGDFGDWDLALLELEWQDMDLKEFGLEPPKPADYSGANTELDPSIFDDTITLKLKYDKIQGARVKAALGQDPKNTLLKALNYESREN